MKKHEGQRASYVSNKRMMDAVNPNSTDFLFGASSLRCIDLICTIRPITDSDKNNTFVTDSYCNTRYKLTRYKTGLANIYMYKGQSSSGVRKAEREGEREPLCFTCNNGIFTARAYARAVLGVVILSVRPSVRLSVTRVHCDKSKWRTADIFIPHETAITLLLWYQEWLVSDAPSVWNLRSNWPTPFKKRRLRPIFAHNVSTVGDGEKSSITEYKVDHGLSNEP